MDHKQTKKEPEPKVPSDLRKALSTNANVMNQWSSLTPIARRDFISWIESAKQAETRARRVMVTCSKLKAGKRRPCCYAVVPMNLYKALGANPKAKAQWSKLTPSERRDFANWIDSAKESETRADRTLQACATLAKGKRRPWN